MAPTVACVVRSGPWQFAVLGDSIATIPLNTSIDMMKFLKWFLFVLAFVAATFVVGGFLLPSTWTVSESTIIKSPSEAVYEQTANLRNWQNWSPWTKEKDPTQVYTYEGPEMGAGAKWLWTSEKMGKGWLEIKEADPTKGIAYELFIDMGSMQSTLHGDITFTHEDDSLKVTWTDRGESGRNLIKRWMSIFIKQMLGDELKEGLSKLKTITEGE